jgi:hypothetical protein
MNSFLFPTSWQMSVSSSDIIMPWHDNWLPPSKSCWSSEFEYCVQIRTRLFQRYTSFISSSCQKFVWSQSWYRLKIGIKEKIFHWWGLQWHNFYTECYDIFQFVWKLSATNKQDILLSLTIKTNQKMYFKYIMMQTKMKTRKYFCVPLWFTIDLFILPSINTNNNWVIDYLLLIYNLQLVCDFIDPSSGRFGPYYIQIKLQKCITIIYECLDAIYSHANIVIHFCNLIWI